MTITFHIIVITTINYGPLLLSIGNNHNFRLNQGVLINRFRYTRMHKISK